MNFDEIPDSVLSCNLTDGQKEKRDSQCELEKKCDHFFYETKWPLFDWLQVYYPHRQVIKLCQKGNDQKMPYFATLYQIDRKIPLYSGKIITTIFFV